MKIRAGFVSNSSSSSFVMIGAEIPEFECSTEEQIKLMDKYGIVYSKYPEDCFTDALYNGEFGFTYYSEPSVIGYVVADGDDSDFSGEDLSLEEVVDIGKKIKDKVKEVTGISIEPKLISGIRNC